MRHPIKNKKEVAVRIKKKEEIRERAETKEEAKEGEETKGPFMPKRIYLSHIQGNRNRSIGSTTNYTTLGVLFAQKWRFGEMLPMLDLRGHRFDNYTFAANIGLVCRYIPLQKSSLTEILGFNVYYDWRQGCLGQFNQIGAGIEVLSSRWDLRANAYVPFGPKKHQKVCVFDQFTGGFIIVNRRFESISYAFNAEFGVLALNSNSWFLYLAGGPYYLARKFCQKAALGGEVRLQPQYKDYVALNLKYTYDPIYRSTFQVEIILSVPFYRVSAERKGPASLTDRQIYQRVERFEILPIARRSCWDFNF